MSSTPSSAVSEEPQPQAGAPPQEPPGTQEDASRTVAELQARNAQLEDSYKRALADLDNYRKRVARDLQRRLEEAMDATVLDWLELVDSVDRAARGDGETFRPLQEQIASILAREGIDRVGAEGEPFDPERHEAVAVQDSGELPDRTIVDVTRSGFARGPRVLRPAEVTVARNA
jgi:molecular chaperone GrpE